jgi:transposase
MRKSFDGLTGIVQHELKADPLSAAIFIFLNRRRNQVKLLLWEGDGFSLYHKPLEKGSYELPAGSDGQLAVRSSSISMLIIYRCTGSNNALAGRRSISPIAHLQTG